MPEGSEHQLAGMRLEKVWGNPPTTVLVGDLPDQGALIGVLVRLYELHVTVLEIGVKSVGPHSRAGQVVRNERSV